MHDVNACGKNNNAEGSFLIFIALIRQSHLFPQLIVIEVISYIDKLCKFPHYCMCWYNCMFYHTCRVFLPSSFVHNTISCNMLIIYRIR